MAVLCGRYCLFKVWEIIIYCTALLFGTSMTILLEHHMALLFMHCEAVLCGHHLLLLCGHRLALFMWSPYGCIIWVSYDRYFSAVCTLYGSVMWILYATMTLLPVWYYFMHCVAGLFGYWTELLFGPWMPVLFGPWRVQRYEHSTRCYGALWFLCTPLRLRFPRKMAGIWLVSSCSSPLIHY